MQIQGPANVHGAQPIQSPHRVNETAPQQSSDSIHGADQLDISAEAEMISRIRDVPDIRADRVADIRQQIEAGTYETGEKLEIAIGRLFDELAG
jgi:negative regulator of flagellin synthesis FlgM